MKAKIIGICICMLVIATALPAVGTINKTTIQPASMDADVPTWTVGDSWTYEGYLFENAEDMSFSYSLRADTTLEVVNDSGDLYTLDSTLQNISYEYHLGNVTLKATRFATITATIEMRKSDLALVSWYQHFNGWVLPQIGSLTIPLPIQVDGWKKTTFNDPWVIMPFPLSDGKNGTLTAVTFEEEYKTSFYWGLITLMDGKSNWSYAHGIDYTCSEEAVTVPYGSVTAYNVSAEVSDYDTLRSYYVEEVGNSVKQLIEIQFPSHVIYFHFELELKSTTYTP